MNKIQEFKLTAYNRLRGLVGSTMGPKGYNVSINSQLGRAIRVTKDGKTVAAAASHDDIDVLGFMRNVVEVATSVETEVGDGTTTATIMATTLLSDLERLVESGIHPRVVVSNMDKMLTQMIKHSLDETNVCTLDNVRPVIEISTNHDKSMTNVVYNILAGIGAYGRYRCTTGGGTVDIFNVNTGYTIDTAAYTEAIINNCGAPKEIEASIRTINSDLTYNTLEKIIDEQVTAKIKETVILCNKVADADFQLITETLMKLNRGGIGVYPVLLSATPNIRQAQLEDIMALTNGNAKVVLERSRTTFQFDSESKHASEHIESLSNRTSHIASGFDLAMHKERVQRLLGGYATIMASGSTPTEQDERGDRINDALLAAQSALREGYVLGGGNHYLKILSLMTDVPEEYKDVLRNYLTAVFKQIHVNAGVEDSSITDMINGFNTEWVLERLDPLDPAKVIMVDDFKVYDSAATPIRVFEATRSLMHTLLLVHNHIPYKRSGI